MSSTNSASLRPAWHKGSSGGRGFQPPPTVSERGDKSRSGSWGSQERGNSSNKFAVLDDEDGPLPGNGKGDEKPTGNSRSEAFRSSFGRGSSTGAKPSGRSLADLAARVPDGGPTSRRHSSYDTRGAGPGRFSNLRSTSDAGTGAPGGSIDSYKPDPKVIRYTREKLLSMRAVPTNAQTEMPAELKMLEGAAVISNAPQDPVCWDTFDGEEIWEGYRERRIAGGAAKAEPVAGPRISESTGDPRRRNAPSNGRWQRGVALPPPEEGGRRKGEHADNPDELWDDPIGGATGAAADFSAFGALPPEAGEAFDFEKMAEASKKLDEEMHGGSKHSESDDDDQPRNFKAVDTSRPLASAGMTITSGSGEGVNVFEDFDAPSESADQEEAPTVRAGTEDPTASSRLMKMIGVEPPKGEGTSSLADGTSSNPWGGQKPATENEEAPVPGMDPIFGSIGGLSLNPWGSAPAPASGSVNGGMDLTGRLEALAAEQKAREQQVEMEKRAQQEAELLRRRQEEEVQRRAMVQRQAEEQARVAVMQHQQHQQQQHASQQSQVELVLMERICSILENSWGRSDLVSILTTLHSEDSRVIPLLSNVDSLRALIARSPQRIALRRDPSFAGDMAVLLLTNAQWQQQQQQQQQQHTQARLQQEELRRRMEEEARAQAQSRNSVQINPELPWFYSDPQNNIQGPFRGEEMRQWLEAGYFKGDLPISQQSSGPFHPLSALFPDLNVAFKARQTDSAGQEEDGRKAAAEEATSEAATPPKVEADARERAEREKAEEVGKRADAATTAERENASKNGGNESSTQLKMMLGLSSSEDGGTELAEVVDASKRANADKRASKGNNRKAQQKLTAESSTATEKLPPAAKPGAAWGGAAKSKPSKSMSEIQQEEARAAALLAAQSGGMPQQSSSGWANVAAGSQGWSSGVVKKSPAPAASGGVNARPPQSRATSVTQPVVKKASSISHQQRASSAASSTPAEEFGTSMSHALEKWCKEQMLKINASDDLTLIAFCMTLNDAHEIRQYLTTYLGATSQVNNFATEFINKRGLGNKQEEWETPGSAKKGRKKKVGGR